MAEQIMDEFAISSTDVYGLGSLLYWQLCGRPPYSGNRASEVLSAVISRRLPKPVCSVKPAIRMRWSNSANSA
ncbi:MAG: hypothetical protein R3C49_07545 [Planctomycetaceae bacterium]